MPPQERPGHLEHHDDGRPAGGEEVSEADWNIYVKEKKERQEAAFAEKRTDRMVDVNKEREEREVDLSFDRPVKSGGLGATMGDELAARDEWGKRKEPRPEYTPRRKDRPAAVVYGYTRTAPSRSTQDSSCTTDDGSQGTTEDPGRSDNFKMGPRTGTSMSILSFQCPDELAQTEQTEKSSVYHVRRF